MFFPSLPSLDFTINSFGGLDLTSIPLAFHFVNTSMFWFMEQYTFPMFTTLDLRHTFCSTCDTQPVPTIPEVLVDSSLVLGRKVQQLLSGVKRKVKSLLHKTSMVISKMKGKLRDMSEIWNAGSFTL